MPPIDVDMHEEGTAKRLHNLWHSWHDDLLRRLLKQQRFDNLKRVSPDYLFEITLPDIALLAVLRLKLQ